MHTEEIGKTCNKCYVLSGILQNQCIDMVNVHGIVDESRHPSWARKVMRTPQAQGNLLHPHQRSETWNARIIDTWVRSSSVCGKVGNVCNQRNILNGRIQNKCIHMQIVFDIVDDSRHPPLAELCVNFGDLQEHKIRKY